MTDAERMDAFEKRIAALEQVVILREKTITGLSAQLAHTQRMVWLKHAFEQRVGELPVPTIKAGSVVGVEVPSGFAVVMSEGQKCGGLIATNGRIH